MFEATTYQREQHFLANYAFHSIDTKGRKYPEMEHPYRGPFQRDRDRIIHCAAFRRLSEKMQVFTAHFGTYHRTRLTHTMEVVGIARTLGRALALNEDLIEAAALLHDLGHPPFGHAGESILDALLSYDGGFDHNEQALRVVEKLEHRYPGFPGLNLSRELLEGQLYKKKKQGTPLLEIQICDMADSIAYDTHDLDDAIEIGILKVEQLLKTSLWKESAKRIRSRWTGLSEDEFSSVLVHDLIEIQVSDVLIATKQRLIESGAQTAEEAKSGAILVAPSFEMAEQKAEAENFLLTNVYKHSTLLLQRKRCRQFIEALFTFYADKPEQLPTRYQSICLQEGIKRAVADFLSGMTDGTVWNLGATLTPKSPADPSNSLSD
ncbi:MAG: dGTP triphosphohydrolase [Thermoguttaceae bacterium]